MEKDEVVEFLKRMSTQRGEEPGKITQWDKVVQPNSSYLIVGDVGTGKSALAYYLLETFGEKYSLTPAVVGIPPEKAKLLPGHFHLLLHPAECRSLPDAIVFIDEADNQLPIEDTRARRYVVNFLSLPRHRRQIFLLAFHFPRLVLGRYLPFFSAFLFKRPPYLLEFAGKRRNDALTEMMRKAEERFAELPEGAVTRYTYVVAPRIRWQGMLENPLCSFWSNDLSEIWADAEIEEKEKPLQPLLKTTEDDETTAQRLQREIGALFPEGMTQEILDRLINYDKNYSLGQLREMCLKEGLSPHGHKKLLAARLLAKHLAEG